MARRFINSIDTLYDTRTGLVVSAAAEPDGLYPVGDVRYLFERTVSRLIEMRTETFWPLAANGLSRPCSSLRQLILPPEGTQWPTRRPASRRRSQRRPPPSGSLRRRPNRASGAEVAVRKAAKPVLLSGGNPQIAKGYGDAPVQAYIAAMPGWKSDVGRRLDALIARTVPGVHKAVKWNSPIYGVEDGVWFLGIHCFTKYIKVAFFRGASLRPVPPGKSKQKDVRYLDIHEDDQLDETQFADWVKQASRLPGERM